MSNEAIFKPMYGVIPKSVEGRPLYNPLTPPSLKICFPVPKIDGLTDESATLIDSLVLIKSSGYVSVLAVIPVRPPQQSLAK